MYPVCAVNKSQYKMEYFSEGGHLRSNVYIIKNISKLIGDEFTDEKPLREFKFEGYLGEDEDETLDPASILESHLGHMACHMQRDKEDINHLPKISKWEVTMKELPVEKKHNE